MEIDNELIFESQATRECGAQLIEKALTLTNPPTAVFCYNDTIAIGAMMKMEEMGVTPGTDIAVGGFEDIPEAAIFSPKITTVSSSTRHMGIQAARLLKSRIEGAEFEPQTIILQPKLIVRQSCHAYKK